MPRGRPRSVHPADATGAQVKAAIRARHRRAGGKQIEISAETVAHLDTVAKPGEPRTAVVARLAREAAERMP